MLSSHKPTRGELAIMMAGLDSRLAAYEAARARTEESSHNYLPLAIYESRHQELVAEVRDVREKLAAFMASEAGRSAGMGLSMHDGRIEFFHRWRLLRARKPPH